MKNGTVSVQALLDIHEVQRKDLVNRNAAQTKHFHIQHIHLRQKDLHFSIQNQLDEEDIHKGFYDI